MLYKGFNFISYKNKRREFKLKPIYNKDSNRMQKCETVTSNWFRPIYSYIVAYFKNIIIILLIHFKDKIGICYYFYKYEIKRYNY